MGSQPAQVMPGMGKWNGEKLEREKKEQGRCRRWDSSDKEDEPCALAEKQRGTFSADAVTCPS